MTSGLNPQINELISAGIEQLRADSHRLGITWTLIPATVASVSGSAGNAWPTSTTYIIQDGATNVTRAMSLIGRIRSGQRVMTLNVPPQGKYIIGYFGGINAQFDTNRISSRNYKMCDTELILTTSPQPISGTLITVASITGRLAWEVEGIFDFDETVAGTTVCIGYLYVNGVQQAGQALFEVTTVNDRATVSQNWNGEVTGAGPHSFQLYAGRTIDVGAQRAGAMHTTIRVTTYE